MGFKLKVTPSFDPKQRKAMAEIKAIVKRHDLGAVVILSSKTHMEFMDHHPEWCTITFTDPRTPRIRLTVKSDPELANASSGHILGMRDMLNRMSDIYTTVSAVLQTTMAKYGKIHHTPPGHDEIDFHDGRTP